MDERDWTILNVLFEQKNITKTAQILYITQPALTKRLMQIEEEFGVKIVNRGIRGVHFTPQGEYLARRAAQMLSTIRQIKEDVINMNDDIVGTLRVGVSNFFGKYQLPELLRQFANLYPNVSFQVETGLSKDIFNLLYGQQLHVGFIRGDYSWPDQKVLLFEEEVVIASMTEINLQSLPDMPRIDYDTDHLYKSLVDHWWTEHYSKPPTIRMNVDRGDTCREMVLRGLGYAIMPSMLVQDIDGVYTIPIRNKNGTAVLRQTWMFYHESALEQNVVNAFVDFVKSLRYEK